MAIRYQINRILAFVLISQLSFPLLGQSVIPQKTENWHGFQKVSFLLDGTPAHYVKPNKPMPGNPWIWRAYFPDWHVEMDSILLVRGFHVAYINTDNRYGDPQAMLKWDDFYNYLTKNLSFAPKVALEGISRGGLYVYTWAKRNPEKVSCIYTETPVYDFKSWPGGRGKSKRQEKEWNQLLEVYGFTEEQALAYDDNPIDHLEGLAAYKVPTLHIIGLKDKLAPPDENTFLLVDRYQKLGGPAYVYSMSQGTQTLEGHHFPIEHPEWWADFVTQHSTPVTQPLPKADYVQLRAGLPNFFQAIQQKKEVIVAYLGGSITHNTGWRDKVSKYLTERFPKNTFTFITAGIPSLGSLPHAFRFEQDVLSKGKPDLLFLEAAVNDHTNETDSLTQVRSLEGIVRHARKNNPAMDIILMAFADPDKTTDYQKGIIPLEIKNHEAVASHYQLPSINLAEEVADRLAAKEFSWEYDFKDLHPSPFGQEIYYQSIKYLLNRSFKNFTNSNSVSLINSELPKALVAKNFEGGKYVNINEAKIEKGWQLVEKWQPTDGVGTREGFVNCPILEATSPDATLSLSFTGNAVGIGLVSGPDAGEILYSIDNGPYKSMDLYTQWSHFLHLPWYKLFAANLTDKKHTLHLKVSENKNAKSKGTACRIVYFLVNSTGK
ncbi:SGNH/GDSL hydrolase family protein [Emticicia sp. C21]|uniref:SGNH/GDSL hydrolase family protein n=1 Tax=Emticicia sp. C21 TaxID=2302915 RepID=UPI000E3548CE|nr:SGNH/GDSL hydrolase family protein [Emticicia sp. C21]RFS14636.1 SGNH/GDSL hydrolase family protein [Emticicia sp. C21]